jgi:hypothetical protein
VTKSDETDQYRITAKIDKRFRTRIIPCLSNGKSMFDVALGEGTVALPNSNAQRSVKNLSGVMFGHTAKVQNNGGTVATEQTSIFQAVIVN